LSTAFLKIFPLGSDAAAAAAMVVISGSRRQGSQILSSPIYAKFIISNGL
jgi:hypothetical protein